MKNHAQIERLQEAVNRLIGGILPFAILGRELKTFDPANPKSTPVDVDDRALRRAWDAVRFATDNLPDPTVLLPQLFDQATVDLLRSYGLERVDRSAQVYYLAQVVMTQAKQLQSWGESERERESGGA